jgi:hypothetical protein
VYWGVDRDPGSLCTGDGMNRSWKMHVAFQSCFMIRLTDARLVHVAVRAARMLAAHTEHSVTAHTTHSPAW